MGVATASQINVTIEGLTTVLLEGVLMNAGGPVSVQERVQACSQDELLIISGLLIQSTMSSIYTETSNTNTLQYSNTLYIEIECSISCAYAIDSTAHISGSVEDNCIQHY